VVVNIITNGHNRPIVAQVTPLYSSARTFTFAPETTDQRIRNLIPLLLSKIDETDRVKKKGRGRH
jgi:hypothetical protein